MVNSYRYLAVVSAILTASPAIAQIPLAENKVHIGIAYLHIFVPGMIDREGPEAVRLQAWQDSVIGLRGGYDFSPYLGVEAEAGFGVGSTTINVTIGSEQIALNTKTKFMAGGFAKAQYHVNDILSVHARAGGIHLASEGSVAGYSSSGTDQELAYGAGLAVRLTDILGFRADWTGYGTENPRVHSVSASVVTRF